MGSNIIDKLDSFIRKYYKNKLLKGLLYSIALLLALYILFVVLEHFGYFSITVRTVLFWFFIIAMAVILGFYVVSPTLKIFSLGSRISYADAAKIIGRHFPEVNDKLLNLLQLQEMGATVDSELLRAGIEQKTEQLSPIPFLKAIDLKKNIKYVKFAAAPLLFIVVSLIIAPSFITEPSKRIINHSTFYEKPAPFSFLLDNKTLSASQQQDFMVKMHIEGDEIPNEVSIIVDGIAYHMQKIDNTHYNYHFKNLQKSHEFFFTAVGVESKRYQIEVTPMPAIINFQASIVYPSYTGKQPEVIANEGDITIPKGSRIDWLFQTKDADTLHFMTDAGGNKLIPNDNGRTRISLSALHSFSYAFLVTNRYTVSDTIRYNISVIDDAYPMIAVLRMSDSTMPDRFFFKGQIKDDYGFSRLNFVIVKTNVSDTSIKETNTLPVSITSDPSQEFYYSIDISTLSLNPGDHIKYYFEVWDNDGVNGSKSTKSQTFEVQVPTDEEIDRIIQNTSSQIHNQAELSISELQQLQNDINEMMRRLVDKKELNWQDRKQLEELVRRQREVKEQLMQMQQQIQQNNRLEEQYRQQSEQLMQKQQEINRLFEQVMNEEMKELMKEMESLLNEMNKDQLQERLEDVRMNNEELERQLDQNMELLRRLELEKRVEQAVQKADSLAVRQGELSRSRDNTQENLRQQQQLSEQFRQLSEEINRIQQDYQNLEHPSEFKVDEQLQRSIQQNQRDAENRLSKGRQKDASQSQRNAAEQLEKLAENLAEAQNELEQEDLVEDAAQVRHLLKNLVQLSFNQEALINRVSSVSVQDPKYRQIILEQNKLKEDFRNVEDSLHALAKRQVAVASVINQELANINSNITKTLTGLHQYNQAIYGNFRNNAAAKTMQYSMTALNNLSLVLAESLDQMQNQMRQNQQQRNKGNCRRQGMKQNGSCNNPGSGKPSPKSMRQLQEELNRQMQSLKQQLDKQGNNPNGRTRIGDRNSMSSEFARMAAQQEQIRRMMQEYAQQLKQQNGGNNRIARELDDLMRQMEQTETDLVNRTITQQTINRQQQIMTRLLQHERADMERERDERRQSVEAKDVYQPSQNDLEQYRRLQENNIELFHTTPPSLNNYYRNKVNDYFFKF